MSIVFPVYHREKITKKRVRIIVVIMTCIVAIFIPALSFFYEGLLDMYVIIALPLYFTLVAAAYIKIFLVASKRSSVSPQVEDKNMNGSDRKTKRALLKDFKLAKACCLVVACFFICFIPGPMSYASFDDDEIDWRLHNAIAVWSTSMIFSNSVLNVSIFFWKNPMLRNEGRKTLQGFISC